MKFILASASPRRLELLNLAGITPDEIIAPDIDESQKKGESPLEYVKRVSCDKAKAVAMKNPDALVLAADTIVVCGRKILDKTEDKKIAEKHLKTISSRRHRVYTAVTVIVKNEKVHTRLVETRVQFKNLNADEISEYLASDQWRGKAGAYGIQGKAAAFVSWINGSHTNIIGLPLVETIKLLKNYLQV